ncbi:MAG: class I SAM-dependent methyltransferase [Streptosporangiaceae bacterium]|jgi:ubiquinone/menaquinone biosynthesis C-methylase UbiE
MPPERDDTRPAAGPAAPTAADFDRAFSAAASAGVRRVWELAQPDLPPQIEPYSFVSAALLRHVAQALGLSPGQTLVDLGCGRGGPGLWLAREADASLIGVDFSPVGVDQAARRAARFGLAGQARFVVGDLTRTGLPDASAHGVVSIDAFHFAADPAAAAAEARRVLRPGARLVLTNWQPKVPHDARLPDRMRIDWPQVLRRQGFAGIEVKARPEWHDLWTRVYRIALDLGDPGDDAPLADLQDEARIRLPVADLSRRIAVTATAPHPSATLDSEHRFLRPDRTMEDGRIVADTHDRSGLAAALGPRVVRLALEDAGRVLGQLGLDLGLQLDTRHSGQTEQVNRRIRQLFPEIGVAHSPRVECFGNFSLQ